MSTQLPQQRLEVPGTVDERDFYTDSQGNETLVTHSDLESTVNNDIKPNLREERRYWVNKPYSFVVIYKNQSNNEKQYTVVEPTLTDMEQDLIDFFQDKLRSTLEYNSIEANMGVDDRARVIRDETIKLMKRYNLLSSRGALSSGLVDRLKEKLTDFLGSLTQSGEGQVGREGDVEARVKELKRLNQRQVERMLYYLVRDFIRFGKIDPIKQDVNIEDISCNGYNDPVFVYHSDYGEQLATNITYEKEELDKFVKTLAQSAGKGISRRQPDVDAVLRDGSRASLVLGTETSDKGTNFTIRELDEIPFTPVDLINWRTFTIEQMAYLWLAVENGKSIIISGGTASGKTTTLNAISLFIPSTTKIVSIEDTRELQMPQTNWLPRKTKESFQEDVGGEIDEYDLLEDALRQRPDYIVMGEIRGEEGQMFVEAMNTGHTTFTTFHANEPKEAIRRFVTDPINAPEAMFEALDIICQQSNISDQGKELRRVRRIVEIERYSAAEEGFDVTDVFQYDRKEDQHNRVGKSSTLNEIAEENGWSEEELDEELSRRMLLLAYLVDRGIDTYAGVTSAIQGYMTDKQLIMSLIADKELKQRLGQIQSMKNVDIDISAKKESLVPRPSPTEEVKQRVEDIFDEHIDVLQKSSFGSEATSIEATSLEGEGVTEKSSVAEQIPSEEVSGPLPRPESEPETEPSDINASNENPMANGGSMVSRVDELFEDTESQQEPKDQVVTSSDLDTQQTEDAESNTDGTSDNDDNRGSWFGLDLFNRDSDDEDNNSNPKREDRSNDEEQDVDTQFSDSEQSPKTETTEANESKVNISPSVEDESEEESNIDVEVNEDTEEDTEADTEEDTEADTEKNTVKDAADESDQ